ncbi:MAG: exonuclease subunit SbcD [Saprospiraceae bacterium]|nr:exonuclease subunit SbcD [Saprospiraceae bacterium]
MKILHTADWHIGKVLHKNPLEEEQNLFLEWLLNTIKTNSIDVLLISGDVFDLANPSVKDRSIYFRFLKKLIGADIKIIITGGNHDSIGLLNAPREILKMLDVSIIGGATDNIEDELIEIKDKDGELKLVVAAVPFLRDKDLRTLESDKKFKNKTEATRAGIKKHYATLAKICEQKYASTPIIAMGHLYAQGVNRSESEREIHVGNSAAVSSDIFPDVFNYVALGHIHQPQIINKNPMIRYSGSPIALSFSEKKDNKCILVVECKNKTISKPQIIKIPKQRELKKISGSLQEVMTEVQNYTNIFPLPAFIELEIKEKIRDTSILTKLDEFVYQFDDEERFKILKTRTEFEQGVLNTADLFKEGANIEDLNVKDVFCKKLDAAAKNDDEKTLLIEVFQELIDMHHEKEHE